MVHVSQYQSCFPFVADVPVVPALSCTLSLAVTFAIICFLALTFSLHSAPAPILTLPPTCTKCVNNGFMPTLQVADYQTAVSNLPASDPGSSDPRISSIKTTLFTLFELSNSATYTSGFDIAKRLADVTAIYNALSDLSQLHTDSQAAAALPNLHDNLAT